MTIVVAGATGATGRHVVKQLLARDVSVKAIVRSKARLLSLVGESDKMTVIEAGVSEIGDKELYEYIHDAEGFISCLGHNLNFRGIYGKPRRLVTDTVSRVCRLVSENNSGTPFKYILMNTSGNRNRDLNEHISAGEKMVVGLIRMLLPPHSDNEHAADYLWTQIGDKHRNIEWVAVRPDSLINEELISSYDVHPSPVRSAIFNPGQTSRINIGHFMAEMIIDNNLWNKWKGQMPVIYNT